ncbi:MAG: FKBP-type peptidyl-prolyl cis-trans isomerase [Halieaceae bacterium]|jgi:FKBP-type peptidyl-prolyl cis-trans isomerase|nr:FKBP-type peptidyl-prolyl cis-trans isomerase [Halieaceae bacterium]
MNKTLIGLAVPLAITLSACNQEPAQTADVTLDTPEQRLSYGIAYGLGDRLKADGVPLDVAAFSAGLSDAVEGNEARLSQEEIGQEMQAYQEKRAAEQAELTAAEAEVNASAGDAYREENASAEGVTTTESGLQYRVITAGDGPTPGPTDVVEVHYRGTLIDGTEFDSSYSRGEPINFGLDQVIPGWSEGLQLMPVGSTYELVIPPELAYGAGGAGPIIGPNATLVFEVELLDIVQDETAEDASAEESAAEG